MCVHGIIVKSYNCLHLYLVTIVISDKHH